MQVQASIAWADAIVLHGMQEEIKKGKFNVLFIGQCRSCACACAAPGPLRAFATTC